MLFNIFKKKKEVPAVEPKMNREKERIAARKGELGEYKIDIQLGQLPKDCRYLSDLLVKNPKATSGYSQIDHVVLTPFGIFCIETKNYQGTIYGGKDRKTWLVNGKFKMMNPFVQNYGHIQALSTFLDKKYHSMFISIVSFTKRCTFKVGMDYRKIASNELIVYDIELSEFIHRKLSVLQIQHKQPLLDESDIASIYTTFSNANITDTEIRREHENALKQARPATSKQATCVICQKPVSDNVKSYCLSNEKFNRKIYCFEHQKTI